MASKEDHKGGLIANELPITTHRKPRGVSPLVRRLQLYIFCFIIANLFTFLVFRKLNPRTVKVALATEWQDNIWPFRPSAPWDISTDFPFPRELDYDVQEGTWLRLDVHPLSGDIVFDMIGDLYCLPASEVAMQSGVTRARPILLGVPHDSDPHFSPNGDRLVFRSDAELGVENIWVTGWKGCEAMDVRAANPGDDQLKMALRVKKFEDRLLSEGVKETAKRKFNRLIREGRHGGKFFGKFLVFEL